MSLLQFEHRRQPLAPKRHYYHRVARCIIASLLILSAFLLAGVVGYHLTCGFSWLYSLLNASMILSGMGPTNPIMTDGGKWFASIYALVSGVVFISTIGIILAPVVHRAFHRFHVETD